MAAELGLMPDFPVEEPGELIRDAQTILAEAPLASAQQTEALD